MCPFFFIYNMKKIISKKEYEEKINRFKNKYPTIMSKNWLFLTRLIIGIVGLCVTRLALMSLVT